MKMMMGAIIRRTAVPCALALALALIATPASAQSGQIKGKVIDAKGAPVDGATVTIESLDTNRKLEVKTKKGEYIQVGLQPGRYKVTVAKDGLTTTRDVKIGLDMSQVDFTLAPGSGGPGGQMSKEDAAKQQAFVAAIQAKFAEGVALGNAGKTDEAVAKFTDILVSAPKCAECYANIGSIYARDKQYDKAEAAYKQAIEVKPDFFEAYNGLATVYNAEKKFDQAAEASAQAIKLSGAAPGGTGVSASSVFNQGVILWNAGKIPDAKAQFEQAVKLDPTLADAHYWLGMANLNEGKLPDAGTYFEQYLKLAPTGQYAVQAKDFLKQIKK